MVQRSQLVGDWKRVKIWLRNVPKRARSAVNEIRDDLLKEAAKEARAEIRANRITPQSKKRELDGSLVTLIEGADYVKAIDVYKDPGGRLPYVGVPAGEIHPGSGLPFELLWLWLRFGTSKMPARPHIDTALDRVMRTTLRRIRAAGFSTGSAGRFSGIGR